MVTVASLVVVSAIGGCSSDDDPDIEAAFSARFEQPTTGPTTCPVQAVHFEDRSTGEPTSWEWIFGDASRSSEQNPTWETNAVTAEVTLTVRRDGASDSVTKRITTHEC
jgi:PKD repeat protein